MDHGCIDESLQFGDVLFTYVLFLLVGLFGVEVRYHRKFDKFVLLVFLCRYIGVFCLMFCFICLFGNWLIFV